MEMSTLRTKRIEILKGMQGNSDSDAIFFFSGQFYIYQKMWCVTDKHVLF